jgi:hypothetical protein
MSTRLGMGDGRCLTVFDSTRLYNDAIMKKQGIAYEDNLSYRKYLQEKGPDAFVVPANGACLAPGFVRQADSGN